MNLVPTLQRPGPAAGRSAIPVSTTDLEDATHGRGGASGVVASSYSLQCHGLRITNSDWATAANVDHAVPSSWRTTGTTGRHSVGSAVPKAVPGDTDLVVYFLDRDVVANGFYGPPRCRPHPPRAAADTFRRYAVA